MLHLALLAAALVQEPRPLPNVVFLLSDDQGWGDVGYHDPELRTPHLDRLAREGVELDQHYVQPQCTPTRVALLTGRYPSRFGPHCTTASNERALPAGTPTLATMFRELGYETALVGKWHLGSRPEWGPNHYGFDHSYGSLAGAVGMYDHRYRIGSPFERTWQRDSELIADEEGHSTDLLTREAVAFLRRERERPFFLYVPFHAVHTPIVERDERWIEQNAHIEAPDRRLFAAALSHLDDAVGQIVAALEETGVRERTLVVFCSDNGGLTSYGGGNYPPPDPALKDYSSNGTLRGQKTQCYEGGLRVPALVSWPGTLDTHVVDAPMHVVDWMPTFASLLDWQPEAAPAWDGRDTWALLTGELEHPAERQLYWTWGKTWDALRAGDWKIVRRNKKREGEWEPGPWQLFDLASDPEERNDLAAEQPERVASLALRFAAERAQDG